MDGKYEELEKRVKNLEEMLKGFLQSEGNEIHIQLDHCQPSLQLCRNTGDHKEVRPAASLESGLQIWTRVLC